MCCVCAWCGVVSIPSCKVLTEWRTQLPLQFAIMPLQRQLACTHHSDHVRTHVNVCMHTPQTHCHSDAWQHAQCSNTIFFFQFSLLFLWCVNNLTWTVAFNRSSMKCSAQGRLMNFWLNMKIQGRWGCHCDTNGTPSFPVHSDWLSPLAFSAHPAAASVCAI